MKEQQYLTFLIEDESFAIDVLNVKEIIPYGKITYIPHVQPYIMGIMNIRGMPVPIIDMGKRLGVFGNIKKDKTTSIIIVSLMLDGEKTDIGFVVSQVNQVFTIDVSNLETTPTFGTKIRKKFIKNIGKIDSKFITILDIEEIFNLNEISQITLE